MNKLIHIGFGNIVNTGKIIAIVSPDSAPIKRLVQNAKESGWKSFENRRNRYWLINNLQDRSYASVRECIYKYHRLGLDVMSDNLTDGRLAILEALGLLQKAHRIKPNSYLMQVFFDAKADEIVHIFKPAFTDERKRIFNIVSEVNPANSSKYNALIQEKTN